VAHHKTDILAKERVEADCKVKYGALTYSRQDWSATQLPSPMCHMAYVYEYTSVEHSVQSTKTYVVLTLMGYPWEAHLNPEQDKKFLPERFPRKVLIPLSKAGQP
jgi:hypothetical protein